MSNNEVNTSRRRFLAASTAAVGAVGAVGIAIPFLGSWQPSAKAKAAGAPSKIDISKVKLGEMMVGEWRGKPIFIIHRSPEQLATLPKLVSKLADPDSKDCEQPTYINGIDRAIKPEYAVMIGICTHLGCSPTYRPEVGAADLGADWLGGFLCPCHGSHYDLSGRVFKDMPAPKNLPIPPYQYVSDKVIIVGVDQGEKA